MATIEDILKSKKKPKEKVDLLAEKLRSDKNQIADIIKCFNIGSVSEKGSCMEAIEFVTKSNPGFAASCLDFVIEHINDEAPRVKWEAARIIGNVAKQFPDKVSEAVPKLWLNTKDDGTVVRWCAAFALTEIAKNNSKLQKELVLKFSEILKLEENSGVRNVYVKALTIINR